MKKIIAIICIIGFFALNSCSKKEALENLLIYKGKKIGENSIISIRGITDTVSYKDVKEFVRYRDSILRGSNLNFKEPIAFMTVKQLKALANKVGLKKNKEEVIFIFGINKYNYLTSGIVSSLGYPSDKKDIKIRNGNWLNNKKDSIAYENYRNNMIKNKIEPYINYQDRPFVSLSKSSIRRVIKIMKRKPKIWNKNTVVYFHYGYSFNKENKYHVAVLFTDQKDLSSQVKYQVGFANRNGTCCPPDN